MESPIMKDVPESFATERFLIRSPCQATVQS